MVARNESLVNLQQRRTMGLINRLDIIQILVLGFGKQANSLRNSFSRKKGGTLGTQGGPYIQAILRTKIGDLFHFGHGTIFTIHIPGALKVVTGPRVIVGQEKEEGGSSAWW